MNKLKNIIYVIAEKYIPIVCALVVILIVAHIDKNINLEIKVDTFDKILDSLINFTSILLGFIGVLLGILFSIKNEVLVKKLFEHKSKDKLKRYFLESFISGMLLITMSIVLYLRDGIQIYNEKLASLLFSIWCGLIWYTVACGYRIIRIMIMIVFYSEKDSRREQKNNMDENKKQQLQDKYRR